MIMNSKSELLYELTKYHRKLFMSYLLRFCKYGIILHLFLNYITNIDILCFQDFEAGMFNKQISAIQNYVPDLEARQKIEMALASGTAVFVLDPDQNLDVSTSESSDDDDDEDNETTSSEPRSSIGGSEKDYRDDVDQEIGDSQIRSEILYSRRRRDSGMDDDTFVDDNLVGEEMSDIVADSEMDDGVMTSNETNDKRLVRQLSVSDEREVPNQMTVQDEHLEDNFLRSRQGRSSTVSTASSGYQSLKRVRSSVDDRTSWRTTSSMDSMSSFEEENDALGASGSFDSPFLQQRRRSSVDFAGKEQSQECLSNKITGLTVRGTGTLNDYLFPVSHFNSLFCT